MNVQSIADRVKGILVNPRAEWEKIKPETITNKELILFYVLPFAAVAALISFFVIWISTYLSFFLALRFGILKLITPIITIIVTAVVINELADIFDSTKNLNNAFKLITYSFTPVLLVDIIVSISWTLVFLSIFGLYGVYIFWLGLPRMMNSPDDRRLVYTIAAVATVIILDVAISALFGIDRLGY